MHIVAIIGIIICSIFVMTLFLSIMFYKLCQDNGEGIIISSAMLIISLALTSWALTANFKTYTKQLYEINSIRKYEDEHDFYLGIDMTYYYFYKESEKGPEIKRLSISCSSLLEDNHQNPCVYEIKEQGKLHEEYIIVIPENTKITPFIIK